jgi:hypothetical protein
LVQALGSQFHQVLVNVPDPIEAIAEELGLDGLPPEPEEEPRASSAPAKPTQND